MVANRIECLEKFVQTVLQDIFASDFENEHYMERKFEKA